MFFIMEDRGEEFTMNVDQFSDSYARDTTVDELKEVRDPNYGKFLCLESDLLHLDPQADGAF